jgi:putative ABC transport system permease protein
MDVMPILSALKRNKVGAILIALQLALTLAIVTNALFIIGQRFQYVSRQTGVAEPALVVISNSWIGHDADRKPLLEADLATLRSVPGVIDAFGTNSVPLSNGGWSTGVSLQPKQEQSTGQTAIYFGDEHTLSTYDLKLVAGRNFTAEDVTDFQRNDTLQPPTIIVTQAFAKVLFKDESPIGKQVYMGDQSTPSTIVGVVDRLQTPWVGRWADRFYENSSIVPHHLMGGGQRFVLRTDPERVNEVMKAAEAALVKVNPARVIDSSRPFAELREEAYRGDRAMAIMLMTVCIALLAITALGIVGLASFWVNQRRKQIGTRRALGATRSAIVRYFQVENALITAGGAVLGVALAVGMNVWLVSNFQLTRLDLWYLPAGVAIVFVLGQVAVFPPARRAATVPPAEATRSV